MRIFARITKVDESTGLVYGRAVQEVPDRASEIFDYASSKPNFEKWSGEIAKATDGKSVGNVRAMHGNVAAGKLTEINFNDAEKAIDVCALVVDPVEREKCVKGVYTGFSIGGKYEKKWADPEQPGLTRYTAMPHEVSLVDLPCVPTAQFTVTKADGTDEMRKFTPSPERLEAERAAGVLIGKADAAEPVLKAAALLLDLPLVEKGLWQVGDLADLVQQLVWAAQDVQWEAESEGDGSTVPAEMRAAVKALADVLVRLAAEEVAEILPDPDAGKAAETGDLAKTDAADAAEDGDGLEKGADDLAKITAERDDLQKRLTDAEGALAKVTSDLDTLQKAHAALTVAHNTLLSMPVPPKAARTFIVEKAADTAAPDQADHLAALRKQVDEMPEGAEKALAMIKLAHAGIAG